MRRPALRPHGNARRLLESAALLATIPAFYLSLLSVHETTVVALYLCAFAVSSFEAAGRAWWRNGPSALRKRHARAASRMLLVVGLVLCALLPAGDSWGLVTVRLGTAGLVIVRWSELWLRRSLGGGLPRSLVAGALVLALCGLGFWWLEPQAHTFGDGLWLAFTTAATVGYGDIVPSTPAAKIFAVFVVLVGFTTFSLVTASIAALWIQNEERRIERDALQDLHQEMKLMRDEIRALRDERQPVHAPGRSMAATACRGGSAE